MAGLTPESVPPAIVGGPRRRLTRRTLAWLAVAAVVVTAAVILAVALHQSRASHGSGQASSSPRAVAVAWAKAVFSRDTAAAAALSCPGSNQNGAALLATTLSVPRVLATSAEQRSDGTWMVRLRFTGPGTDTSTVVYVQQRERGRYLICDR